MCLQSLSCVLLSKLQIAKPAASCCRGSGELETSLLFVDQDIFLFYAWPLYLLCSLKEGWKLEMRQSTIVSKDGFQTKFISEQQF